MKKYLLMSVLIVMASCAYGMKYEGRYDGVEPKRVSLQFLLPVAEAVQIQKQEEKRREIIARFLKNNPDTAVSPVEMRRNVPFPTHVRVQIVESRLNNGMLVVDEKGNIKGAERSTFFGKI